MRAFFCKARWVIRIQATFILPAQRCSLLCPTNGIRMSSSKRIPLTLCLLLAAPMASVAFGANNDTTMSLGTETSLETVVPLYDHKYLRYAVTQAVAVRQSPTLTRHYVRDNPKSKMLLLLPLQLLSQYSCRGCNAPRPHTTPVLYGTHVEASMSTYSPD